MREIEVKARVLDRDAFLGAITSSGVVLSGPVIQNDKIYLEHPLGLTDIRPGTPVLRLRNTNGTVILNVKRPAGPVSLDNFEAEARISDLSGLNKLFASLGHPEVCHHFIDARHAQRRLEYLGYHQVVEVAKRRRSGKLGEFTLCFDTVDRLGSFVELEALTSDAADPGVVTFQLKEALVPFGISEGDYVSRSYDRMIFDLDR